MRVWNNILSFIGLVFIINPSTSGGVHSGFVDSIYNHMSLQDHINQLVWVEINNQAELEKLKKKHLLTTGGIYLSRPVKTNDLVPWADDHHISLALQLDQMLNPAPDEFHNLPGLLTLSAVSKKELLIPYFEFLRTAGKAYGYDFLVLPEGNTHSDGIRHLLDEMTAFDPDYFKKAEQLTFTKAKRKRDYKALFEDKTFWVVSPGRLANARKDIGRYAKKIHFEEMEHIVKSSIRARYTYRLPEKAKLSPRMDVAIKKAAVVPLQKGNILPLTADTLCFITHDPYGMMATMLRKYAYVITSYEDIVRSQAPILFDHYKDDMQSVFSGRTLIYFGRIDDFDPIYFDAGLIVGQEDHAYDYIIPQQLFGASPIEGLLPSGNELFAAHRNEPVPGLGILGYAPAETVGLDSEVKYRIEQIVNEAILSGATPGCQIALSVGGSIVLDKGYGYLTYDSLVPVYNSTLYDLASVTKVSATLLAVMDLYEQGLLDIDKTISDYLPEYQLSNKAHITIRSLLSHQSGLVSYVPFWRRVLTGDRMQSFYYASSEDEANDKRSYGLKPGTALRDSLNSWIRHSPLLEFDSLPYYNYSDIGFMIMHQVVERIVQKPLDQYLAERYYEPLGLKHIAFNPMKKGFERFEIAPTEYDYYFRDEQVWGEVHDRNAAIFGGVAGHAGLFANAHDLLVILQMLLQDGQYGGRQYLNAPTLNTFNQRYFENNRRALGWDKKDEGVGNTSVFVSDESYGHTGFTGTMVWADPEFDIAFVFLSNRVYPDSSNYKLNKMNIRTRIQDVVYEAILSKWMNEETIKY